MLHDCLRQSLVAESILGWDGVDCKMHCLAGEDIGFEMQFVAAIGNPYESIRQLMTHSQLAKATGAHWRHVPIYSRTLKTT